MPRIGPDDPSGNESDQAEEFASVIPLTRIDLDLDYFMRRQWHPHLSSGPCECEGCFIKIGIPQETHLSLKRRTVHIECVCDACWEKK